jgi:hypothetical protein
MEAYKNYLIKIATLLGAPVDDATNQADELVSFETRLARVRNTFLKFLGDLRKVYT